MKTVLGLLRCIWKADAFSPTAFVARAVIIALCYCGSELAGLREYTTFLSGTSANLNVSWQTAATLGLIHLLLYVAFILLAPVCLITAGLLLLCDKWSGRTKSHVSEAYECENPAVLRLRQEMLRRARIALREAQVLSALLDHVRNQPVCTTGSDRPMRAVFGFQLLDAPNQALSTESQKTPGPENRTNA